MARMATRAETMILEYILNDIKVGGGGDDLKKKVGKL